MVLRNDNNCAGSDTVSNVVCTVDLSNNAEFKKNTCENVGGTAHAYDWTIQCNVQGVAGAGFTYNFRNIVQCLVSSCSKADLDDAVATLTEQLE